MGCFSSVVVFRLAPRSVSSDPLRPYPPSLASIGCSLMEIQVVAAAHGEGAALVALVLVLLDDLGGLLGRYKIVKKRISSKMG